MTNQEFMPPTPSNLNTGENLDTLSKLVHYLLLNQVNAQTNCEPGEGSNQKLRQLFLELLRILQPSHFCDIGSRDGESSLKVHQLVPECCCYAFEANPEIYKKFHPYLQKACPDIQYLNLAVGDSNQPITIFAPIKISRAVVADEIVEVDMAEPADTGRSSLLRRNEDAEYQEFQVDCVTLDRFLVDQSFDFKESSLALWIDVEGASSTVLRGAKESLNQTKIIFIEVEGEDFWEGQVSCHQIASELIQLGFVPIARDREYYDKQFNLLFVHQNYLDVVYPYLFDFKSFLSSTRINYRLQKTDSILEGLTQNFQELQERIGWIESFLDGYIEGSLNESLTSFEASPSAFSPSYSKAENTIPVYILSFNNLTYVANMVEQFGRIGCHNLIIIDNASTYPPLINYFEQIKQEIPIVRLTQNYGPHILFSDLTLYNLLPGYFCITDPDLEFNANLPSDFVSQLLQLTEEFQAGKAGFSLDITQPELMVDRDFLINGKPYKIWEWESQFWQHPVRENIYRAALDTTFAVYNKKYFDRIHHTANAIRVAGDFTCRHLPWYRDNSLPSEEEDFYRQTSQHSYYLGDKH